MRRSVSHLTRILRRGVLGSLFERPASDPPPVRPVSAELAALLAESCALSRRLMVTLRFQRPSIPIADDQNIELEIPELSLLYELARGDGRTAGAIVGGVVRRTRVDDERLHTLLLMLRTRGLLVGARAAGPAVPWSAEATTTHSAAAGFDWADLLLIATPLVLRVSPGGFECADHEGRLLVRLDPVELAAASQFWQPVSKRDAFDVHRRSAESLALDAARFDELLDRLARAGLLQRAEEGERRSAENRFLRSLVEQETRIRAVVERHVAIHEAAEREREAATGRTRTRVVPVDLRSNPVPLALGMIVAHAKAHGGGRLVEHFQFYPEWRTHPSRLSALVETPAIFLFSNYVWSHVDNLRTSEQLKRLSLWSVTIHGGPDTPKYEGDIEAYFRANPHVDVTVRGEGEVTAAHVLTALAGAVGDGAPDLSVLHDIPGICYRDGDRVVRTAERERIADLDDLPSPYLTGVFDVHGEAQPSAAIIETNRGCPYGCTFCDWGSATLSRIRKFSLDRVFAELEWCAQRQVPRVICADANFGIFERDVEIAEKFAELKRTYGYPQVFNTNYAKNTTKYLSKIVSALTSADVLTEGLLSLQSMDPGTLDTVQRSNIKVEKYDELAREFHRAKLPLFIDLMVGLPGSTSASFRSDLQGCIDREVTAKIYQTEVLVNSPMNEPAYREQHRIETAAPFPSLVRSGQDAGVAPSRAFVVSTSSFTRQEYDEMMRLRRVFVLCENLGALRHVARYLRQEAGLLEIDFYEDLRLAARNAPEQWPTTAFAFDFVTLLGVAPASWQLFIEEVHEYVTRMRGVADDSALRTVFAVQHALLPTRGRTFPVRLELAHDYAAWHAAILEAKDRGAHDWTTAVPSLRSLGPAPFVIDDPHEVTVRAIGYRMEDHFHADWELASAVSRSMPREYAIL